MTLFGVNSVSSCERKWTKSFELLKFSGIVSCETNLKKARG